jgi:hypothetical protein
VCSGCWRGPGAKETVAVRTQVVTRHRIDAARAKPRKVGFAIPAASKSSPARVDISLPQITFPDFSGSSSPSMRSR